MAGLPDYARGRGMGVAFLQTPPPASPPPLPEYVRTWASPDWQRYFVRTALMLVLAGHRTRDALHNARVGGLASQWFHIGFRVGKMAQSSWRTDAPISDMVRDYAKALDSVHG